MGKVSNEHQYTQAELIKKVSRIKKMAAFTEKAGRQTRRLARFLRSGKPSRGTYGAERYFDSKAGRIRTLTYNMEGDKKPLFINMHGGGFILGSPDMDDRYMAGVSRRADVKIISVDYSLAPEAPFPKALDECAAIVDYAIEHAAELGIDPDRIAIGGHSAGGNLAAAVCLKQAASNNISVRCVLLDYPPLDVYTDASQKPRGKGLIARTFLSPARCRILDACYCPNREERKNPLVSPLYATQEQLSRFPPTLILTAGLDSLCAEAELFGDKLRQAGASVTHRRFENSMHGFTLKNKPDGREGWELMIAFLKEHLLIKNYKLREGTDQPPLNS